MGGAQPLAAMITGASCWRSKPPARIDPPAHAICRRAADTLDEALEMIERWPKRRGEIDRPARQRRRDRARIVDRGIRPDVVTDQTRRTTRCTATCRRVGRWPSGARSESGDPKSVENAARASMREHVEAMLEFWGGGVRDVRLRQQHTPGGEGRGCRECVRLPGIRAGIHPSAVLRRIGPFRWVASRANRRTSTTPTPR